MPSRPGMMAIAFAALALSVAGARAFDDSTYPNLKGQWTRFVVPGLPGQPSFDQTKPWGFGQDAPLTPDSEDGDDRPLEVETESPQHQERLVTFDKPGGYMIKVAAVRGTSSPRE